MDKRSLIFIFVTTTAFLLLNNYLFQPDPAKMGGPATEMTVSEANTQKISTALQQEEIFYLLQQDWGQVVFSTLGGAIAEINLAVSQDEKDKSKIESVAIDNQIEEKAPQNAYYPFFAYHIIDENGKEIVEKPTFSGHTPLLRRSLKSSEGDITFRMPAHYYATSLTDEASSNLLTYKVSKFTKDSIELIGKDEKRTIYKTYRLLANAPYAIEMEVKVEGDASGLWLSSGVTEVDLVNGAYSPILQYLAKEGKRGKTKKLSLPKTLVSYDSVRPTWSGICNGYFSLIIDPLSSQTMGLKIDKVEGDQVATRLTILDPDFDLYPADKYPGYLFLTPYKVTTNTTKYLIYAGPTDKKVLAQVDQVLAQSGSDDQLSDVVSSSSWLSSIIDPFAKFLSIFLNWFYSMTHSWGFSIILLTLLLRVATYPINQWSIRSQKRMQEITPKQKAIQDKFKNDPKRMQMELAMLYRNERVNPFVGCLPLLLQFPFLIGMYQLLQSNYSLRGASFIPGWIDNLAAPDTLFSWATPVIFFGTSFHILPFVLGALTYVQGKMNIWMQKNQKVELTDQQKQMNSMMVIFPFLMVFLFYNMASGLNIYWVFSTLFAIIQQWFVMRASEKSKKPKKAR